MTFEDDFRSSLHTQAGDLDLHGRGATEVMHLARRRQHRARRAGVVAAAGVLTIGGVGAISLRNGANDEVSVASSGLGLPDVGPLDLDWQATPGGITGGMFGESRMTQDAAGAIYALSTAPGSQFSGDGDLPPAALYRLAEDGTWQVAGPGAVPGARDITADGTVLYALSTSPAGSGYESVLSSSSDGGTTWNTAAITPIAPPNAVVAWQGVSTLSIETVPGASVAVVATAFTPPESLLESAAARAGVVVEDVTLGYQLTAAGIEVIDPRQGAAPREKEGAIDATGTTMAPQPADPSAEPAPPGSAVTSPPTTYVDLPVGADNGNAVVATIPWADLGIAGPTDLGVRSQVLVNAGDAWVPVDAAALDGLSIHSFQVIGQELVIEGSVQQPERNGASAGNRTLASTDGRSWREVTVTENSRLLGLGSAWVDVPWQQQEGQGPSVRSSLDRGATWQSMDLASVDGRLAGTSVTSVASGPLGLAAVAAAYPDGSDPVTYLLTSRDLTNWTVTPISDLTGSPVGGASVFVGNDRIVVSAAGGYTGDPSAQPASVTVIGTPTR